MATFPYTEAQVLYFLNTRTLGQFQKLFPDSELSLGIATFLHETFEGNFPETAQDAASAFAHWLNQQADLPNWTSVSTDHD
jgi:hypothetical protein